ncbi:hypothetical protein PoB_001282700 [Plakobranchus ocellatus]|uniref:Uncharacterized protein n=1 Tax=Plakobranchus ocellatus TaxID=259542 RepID=A0AAV3YV18_9GAST|nr:hypothetical protein PoB_001282700 [Plakobranchus ocellatus]
MKSVHVKVILGFQASVNGQARAWEKGLNSNKKVPVLLISGQVRKPCYHQCLQMEDGKEKQQTSKKKDNKKRKTRERRARPQQGDIRLLGLPSGQGAGGRARTRDRRVPADLRADSLATVPPSPLMEVEAELN